MSQDDHTTERVELVARPSWARPVMPPEMLAQPGVGVSILERMADWPRAPEGAPDSLVVRCSANYLELKVNNILPVGWFTFVFGAGFIPFLVAAGLGMLTPLEAAWQTGNVLRTLLMLGLVLLMIALVGFIAWIAFNIDVLGGAGENYTVLDRKSRKVYARLPRKLSKGEWNWDDLHPYTDRRNAVSRVNETLLLVQLDPTLQKLESMVQIQIAGMHKEPLLHTYAFIKQFMEKGVSDLPPLRLTAKPEPGWYTSMPPWFFWLPRPLAKSIWSFFIVLFTWPLIVWARLLSRVLPYSCWPADFEARLQADEGQGTAAEKAWLANNLQPPEPLPWTARLAFASAVVVSAPYWWAAVRHYVDSLAKFVGY